MSIKRPEPWLLLALGLAAAGSAELLPAQVEPPVPRIGMTPDEQYRRYIRQQNWERSRMRRGLMFPYSAIPREAPLPFHLGFRPGLQQMFPFYQGLPTYPENVPGYGAYPGVQPTDQHAKRTAPLRPPKSREDRWPSWIEGGIGPKASKSTPTQAVLVQTSDRVWVVDPGAEAYVPLQFFDKFRFLETGSRVLVRGRGALEIYCHDGSTIRSRGPVEFAVARMNREVFDLRLDVVKQFWLRARERSVLLTLPDGTVLTALDSLLHIVERGDRVLLFNNGPGVISYQGAMGKGKLAATRYIALWLERSQGPRLGAGLEFTGDVSTVEEQNHMRVSGGSRGQVTFSGARFKLDRGEKLVLTPLAGNRFPQRGVGLQKK
ncbi:MAG: hypothetical protein V3U11_08210 [Planctomycetota bacterium]